ncbi:MAG: hypothetical protein INQ03_09245 [Candidatus Heimdallarchaeota archaeon]|nr:hypothetical protein [Candidatus Heimdallarchaeota archaeon]
MLSRLMSMLPLSINRFDIEDFLLEMDLVLYGIDPKIHFTPVRDDFGYILTGIEGQPYKVINKNRWRKIIWNDYPICYASSDKEPVQIIKDKLLMDPYPRIICSSFDSVQDITRIREQYFDDRLSSETFNIHGEDIDNFRKPQRTILNVDQLGIHSINALLDYLAGKWNYHPEDLPNNSILKIDMYSLLKREYRSPILDTSDINGYTQLVMNEVSDDLRKFRTEQENHLNDYQIKISTHAQRDILIDKFTQELEFREKKFKQQQQVEMLVKIQNFSNLKHHDMPDCRFPNHISDTIIKILTLMRLFHTNHGLIFLLITPIFKIKLTRNYDVFQEPTTAFYHDSNQLLLQLFQQDLAMIVEERFGEYLCLSKDEKGIWTNDKK